jgi:hypothetical protein
MKKQSKTTTEETVALRLWTPDGAAKIVPYIRSLSQSLREAWLELRQAQSRVRKLETRPGRPDRDTLIQLEESQRDVEQAEAHLEETLDDMLALSAYCVDPGAGLVVVPTLCKDVLAWFVFDLFDPRGLIGWRLHTDPLETRRPLSEFELPAPPAAATEASAVDGARLN